MSLGYQFAAMCAVAGSAFVSLVGMAPPPETSDFFEVRSVEATRHGDTAILSVDRVIHQPIHMGFSVRVEEKTPTGWQEVCPMASGVILYQPDAVLPDPVTLDWWTWGVCPTLPPGPSRIVTTWAPDARGLEPVTVISEVK